MAARKPGPLDAMVGNKIRMFRINRGMSQTALAERIGVSFQQVQKYEKGANRVGASRLSQIASVLGISVGDLFESSQQKIADPGSPVHLLAEPGALRVLKAYLRTNSRVRLAIAKLVESIADQKPNVQKSMTRASATRTSAVKASGAKASGAKASGAKAASVARLDTAGRGERRSSRARI
jgi:transcriptional regulator with XRE-family HTH domain